MSKHSRVSARVSPLLWLVPLPFVLAAFVPVDLPREHMPEAGQRVAAAAAEHQSAHSTASAPGGRQTGH